VSSTAARQGAAVIFSFRFSPLSFHSADFHTSNPFPCATGFTDASPPTGQRDIAPLAQAGPDVLVKKDAAKQTASQTTKRKEKDEIEADEEEPPKKVPRLRDGDSLGTARPSTLGVAIARPTPGLPLVGKDDVHVTKIKVFIVGDASVLDWLSEKANMGIVRRDDERRAIVHETHLIAARNKAALVDKTRFLHCLRSVHNSLPAQLELVEVEGVCRIDSEQVVSMPPRSCIRSIADRVLRREQMELDFSADEGWTQEEANCFYSRRQGSGLIPSLTNPAQRIVSMFWNQVKCNASAKAKVDSGLDHILAVVQPIQLRGFIGTKFLPNFRRGIDVTEISEGRKPNESLDAACERAIQEEVGVSPEIAAAIVTSCPSFEFDHVDQARFGWMRMKAFFVSSADAVSLGLACTPTVALRQEFKALLWSGVRTLDRAKFSDFSDRYFGVASANLVAADDVKEVAQFMEALATILMHGARQHPTPFNPCDAWMDFRGLTREKAIKTVHTMHCDGLLSASFDGSLKLWRFGFVAS